MCEAFHTGLQKEHDRSAGEIETSVGGLTGQRQVFKALREYKLAPPSTKMDSARQVMRRLCEKVH